MSEKDLKFQIQEHMKEAMRAKEQLRLSTIRMLKAAIKQREIDERIELDDSAVITIVNKMIKQRRESAKQYKDAERQELAEKELKEIDILQVYLPKQVSETEIENAVKDAITKANANSMQDMGKVMGLLKDQLQGRADMSQVSAKVKAILNE